MANQYQEILEIITAKKITERDTVGLCRFLLEKCVTPRDDEQRERLGELDNRLTEYIIYFLDDRFDEP